MRLLFFPFRFISGIGAFFFGLVLLGLFVFVAWIIPWVFVLPAGFLAYFPYEADGKTRYMQVIGQTAQSFGAIADRNWIDTVPNSCKKALVAAEDGNFYTHNGVDWAATHAAFEKLWVEPAKNESMNVKKGRKAQIKGGSTITQQIVKNAFLSRSVSSVRKGREILGALLLNAILNKDNQLIWYFNLVEFGPKVYGIEAAAEYYFKAKPNKLSEKQCSQLVAILPSPIKWGASLKKGAPTAFLARRTQTILARMSGKIEKPFEPWVDDREVIPEEPKVSFDATRGVPVDSVEPQSSEVESSQKVPEGEVPMDEIPMDSLPDDDFLPSEELIEAEK